MSFWRSLFTGRPGPAALAFDIEPAADSFAVDSTSVPPGVVGLASYETALAAGPRVSRAEASRVPAVKRSRDLVAGTIGTLPLITVKADLSVDRDSWLSQPERDVPRSVTMTRTAEDLFFEGVSWWFIRDADEWTGYPKRGGVVRLRPGSVDVLPTGRVRVSREGNYGITEEWPDDGQLIRFDSPNDPVLIAGANAIRQYATLAAAARRHADGIPPVDYFTPADGIDPGTAEEVRTMLDDWQKARNSRSTGYVPAALTYHSTGWDPDKLQLAEQLQHAVLEIARVAGVDPEELGVSTTSRTYANQFDRRKAFLDFTVGGYRAAIEDRLSMGDATPRGTLVRFDLDAFLRTDALSRYTAAKVGIEVGALTPEEVREDERRPALEAPPAPGQVPAVAQAPALRQVG